MDDANELVYPDRKLQTSSFYSMLDPMFLDFVVVLVILGSLDAVKIKIQLIVLAGIALRRTPVPIGQASYLRYI